MLVLFYRMKGMKEESTSFDHLSRFHVVFELSRFAYEDFRGFGSKNDHFESVLHYDDNTPRFAEG